VHFRLTPTLPTEQRGSGRAFASSNWRTLTAEPLNHPAAPPRSPIDEAQPPQKTTQRSTNDPSAIAEGRRIYLGNLPYAAKKHEIAAFLEEEGYKLCVPQALFCSLAAPANTKPVLVRQLTSPLILSAAETLRIASLNSIQRTKRTGQWAN
jgi:hypothetical protein